MKPASRSKRALVVFGGTLVTLLAVELLRGQPLGQAASAATLWAGIVSSIFVASRLYRSIRGLDSQR